MLIKTIKISVLSIIAFPIYSADQVIIPYDPSLEAVPGYHYIAPRIQGNIDNFSDEKVVVLYRGINFLKEKFSQEGRHAYIAGNHVGQSMFCSAAYQMAALNYDSNHFDTLKIHATNVAEYVNELDNGMEITVNGMDFSNYRFAFQNLYSNNYKGFFEQLRLPSGDYTPIFEDLPFKENPHLSFSDHLRHPLKYSGGIKNYGSYSPLLPSYDIHGRPHHPVLGKLFGVILDEAAVEELQPLNVATAHRNHELKLSTHFRNDILSEHEISIAGQVPGESVVFEIPFEVPDFSGPYKPYYPTKYGMTKLRYNNYSKFFKNATKTNSERIKKEHDLVNALISSPYEDNNLIYKNCLEPKISTLFNQSLGQIESKIGTLSLEFTID